MKHVQVFAIDNFDSLQKEALLQIPVSNEPVYGDYDVHGDPTKWDFDSKPYSDVTRRMITPAISKYCKSWECISCALNTIVGYDGKIKEGEVVLFPSMTPHKSNPVHGKKIIIGFNWDMYSDMKTREEVQ